MQTQTRCLAIAIGLTQLIGCSDEDNSKPVSELSAEEGQELCKRLTPHLAEIAAAGTEATCAVEALQSDDCSTTVEQCATEASQFESMVQCQTGAPASLGAERCVATVNQVEGCYAALARATRVYAKKVTCSSDFSQLPEPPSRSRECEDVTDDCVRAVATEAVSLIAGER
jgi:hypothetical protein